MEKHKNIILVKFLSTILPQRCKIFDSDQKSFKLAGCHNQPSCCWLFSYNCWPCHVLFFIYSKTSITIYMTLGHCHLLAQKCYIKQIYTHQILWGWANMQKNSHSKFHGQWHKSLFPDTFTVSHPQATEEEGSVCFQFWRFSKAEHLDYFIIASCQSCENVMCFIIRLRKRKQPVVSLCLRMSGWGRSKFPKVKYS